MADDLGKLLQAAADSWHAQLRSALADHMPTAALGAGAAVLPHLGGGGLLQSELTARMGLSKQAIQQLLDQLETQGLVRRVPDAVDKRAKRVELTEAGAAAAARRQNAEAALEDHLRNELGKKRFKAVRKALRELSAS